MADSLGISTAGHFQWALPLSLSLRLGSGEHIEAAGLQDYFGHEMPTAERHHEIARQIAESGIFITTTIRAITPDYADSELLQAMLDRAETSYVPRSLRDAVRDRGESDRRFDEFKAQYDRALAITKFLHDRGVRFVLGTDAGGGLTVPGFSVHDELEALVAAGMTPAEALTTATVNVSTLLNGNGGRIEVGRDADFLLVSENPLENIARTRSVRGVFTGDVWIDREALNQILIHLKKP